VRTLDATVTVVDNVGSPDSLLVTVVYAFEFQGSRRRYVATFPAFKADLPEGVWPPRVGDTFPVSYDLPKLSRPRSSSP
jgi:hypothetical protein